MPTIADSASGESMTRSSPKSFCRPSVMRKTPPSLPMSSPMMRTFLFFSRALAQSLVEGLRHGHVVVAIDAPPLTPSSIISRRPSSIRGCGAA